MTNTTASITRFCKRRASQPRWPVCASNNHGVPYIRMVGLVRFSAALVFGFALALFGLCWNGSVVAAEVQLKAVNIESNEEGIQLNADFELALSTALTETIRKGVPLYFIVEFELTRGRWYWLDDVLIRATRERRVAYAPLTEQYRVTTSGISQNFTNADDVRRVLSRIRSWTIAEKGRLKPGEKFDAAIRFRLDTSQLPKPFQLDAFGSRDWSLSSNWHRWTITIGKDGVITP